MTAIDWTTRLVEAYLADAAETLRRLPEQRYQGYANTWPEILQVAYEGGSSDRPTRLTPSPAAIDQMDRALRWLLWLECDSRRLVWDRANKRPWKFVCAELGIDRTTAWRHWTYALVTIAARLNAGFEHAPFRLGAPAGMRLRRARVDRRSSS